MCHCMSNTIKCRWNFDHEETQSSKIWQFEKCVYFCFQMNLLIGQIRHMILVFPLSCCSSSHILLHLSQILMKLTFSLCIWERSAQQTVVRERPVPMHWEDQVNKFLPLCKQSYSKLSEGLPCGHLCSAVLGLIFGSIQ